MERLMLFIKHKLGLVWNIIELINNLLFGGLYKSRLEGILTDVFKPFNHGAYHYRRLTIEDAGILCRMINNQPVSDLNYFKPHAFDEHSITKQLRKPSLLLMGTFRDDVIVGYFFLRFFANRKCFVGRLIDKEHRGKGIGLVMNNIMYATAWRMKFRCLSTISLNNNAVIKAHSGNRNMIVLKKLRNDYLLVEFLPVKQTCEGDSVSDNNLTRV
jgi:hypothetical protein